MKLSQEAVDKLLHIIFAYSRVNGIPYDYYDLEAELKKVETEVRDNALYITSPVPE